MWLQSLKNKKGSATILSLVAMLVLGASAGTYMISSGTGLGNGNDYGETVSAQYAAEAGITYALTHAKQNTPSNTGIWDKSTIAATAIAVDSSNSTSPTFKITITSIATNDRPAGLASFVGDYFKITSIGQVGNTVRSIDAYITIPSPTNPSPITTFDLMNDADFSSSKWTMSKNSLGAQFAIAPTDSYYQVLFKDTVYANDINHKDKSGNKGFTLDYNVNLKKTFNSGATGYGIYYLATGNADNMSAYVVQYDPGLTPDQIVVKKVIASKKSTTTPWSNEVFAADGTTNSFQHSMNETSKSSLPSQQWDGTPPKLKGVNPSTYASQDVMAISMTDVLNKLNALKINNTTNNKMLGQSHQITIDARPDSNDKVVHTISIDGLEILKFIDRGQNGAIFTEGSTGLRVWNAQAEFYNNTNGLSNGSVGSIQIRSWGKEKT